jgi:hypothetical protein
MERKVIVKVCVPETEAVADRSQVAALEEGMASVNSLT